MSLVKSSELKDGKANGHARNGWANGAVPNGMLAEKASADAGKKANGVAGDAQRKRARTFARQQQAAERIATATVELSSGVTEAASASEQLKQAMESIAAAAEEAASASQQSLKATNGLGDLVVRCKTTAEESIDRTGNLQTLLVELRSQIEASIASISSSSDRQGDSVRIVEELERQDGAIGEIVKTVAHIADQTNLLALNAAIEAARAGEHTGWEYARRNSSPSDASWSRVGVRAEPSP